jgi:hypothetical protein
VTLSDFSGKEIKEGEAAVVRVLSHPLLDHAVKLDAGALEVASLKGTNRELVEIELLLPSTPPEKLVLDLATFDKLFKHADKDDVLNSAEGYYGEASAEPKRRGRPRKEGSAPATAPKVKRDPQQLQAIREWWRGQGNTIGDRGRIPASVEDAYNEAHKGS